MKNPSDDTNSISRRGFVRTAALAATAVGSGLSLTPTSSRAAAAAGQAATGRPMIGFQAEVTYLLRYGIERFLDDVQTRASVNTLLMHSRLYNGSWAGLDEATNPNGNFGTAHLTR